MSSCIHSAIFRKIMLLIVLVPVISIILSAGQTVSAKTDTTWSVTFRLNMTKAVNQHIFNPDSDYVYVVMDHGIQPFRLVPGPGYTYTGTLFDELDSGNTYHYKFRINDNLFETVDRQVTAQPGMVIASAWWNDDPLNYTSFTVNMKYAVQYGLFNPATDTVCIVGTMNDFKGSPRMQRVDTTLNYTYIYSLDPGSVQLYKYRINADSSGLELLFRPERIIRIPDTLLEVTNDFNNFNPAKRLMTFSCNMSYFISAHHFYPSTDFVDVGGNFNNWGENDVLFDTNNDSIYTLEKFIDTAWFHQGPLEFKFRINGSWKTSELCCVPYRTYQLHDTINQNPNIFTCYYSNLNPAIPTPPWVFDVAIQGQLIYKKLLSGIYSYENVNGISEGKSTYKWYQSPDAIGSTLTPIDSAWFITYKVDTLDIGKWLVFEVTPVSVTGDSAVGLPVRVFSSNSISAWDVGIGEFKELIAKIYPNPAIDFITIETRKEVARVELINQMGQAVLTADGFHSNAIRINVNYLPSGIYFLRAVTKKNETGLIKLIKQ